MAKDLVANRGNVLVVAGQRQPIEVHLLAHAINSALGAIGNTVTFDSGGGNSGADLKDFDPSGDRYIVILGGNPAYNLNWLRKSRKVPRTFVLAITKTKRAKNRIGIFRRRIISNLGAMRQRATESCSNSAVDSTVVRWNDGIGISCASLAILRRITDESLRNCSTP
jgi:hypothetical protein